MGGHGVPTLTGWLIADGAILAGIIGRPRCGCGRTTPCCAGAIRIGATATVLLQRCMSHMGAACSTGMGIGTGPPNGTAGE